MQNPKKLTPERLAEILLMKDADFKRVSAIWVFNAWMAGLLIGVLIGEIGR